ncbi:unnamed protein product [Meloidogyne enterolobii]|uniref:Uncharacterized protein n=1 Tax=Meloidogyne enterolobii TaxID=390850 RepID=A0ACB1AV12_MELEN
MRGILNWGPFHTTYGLEGTFLYVPFTLQLGREEYSGLEGTGLERTFVLFTLN